jgi:predicted GIY-YIG superfamily endonuclease
MISYPDPWFLEKHSMFNKRGVPSDEFQKAGLYFIFHNGLLLYVGKSFNIQTRIREHQNKKGFESSMSISYFIEPDESRRDALELMYIEHYKPVMNGNTDWSKTRNNAGRSPNKKFQ